MEHEDGGIEAFPQHGFADGVGGGAAPGVARVDRPAHEAARIQKRGKQLHGQVRVGRAQHGGGAAGGGQDQLIGAFDVGGDVGEGGRVQARVAVGVVADFVLRVAQKRRRLCVRLHAGAQQEERRAHVVHRKHVQDVLGIRAGAVVKGDGDVFRRHVRVQRHGDFARAGQRAALILRGDGRLPRLSREQQAVVHGDDRLVGARPHERVARGLAGLREHGQLKALPHKQLGRALGEGDGAGFLRHAHGHAGAQAAVALDDQQGGSGSASGHRAVFVHRCDGRVRDAVGHAFKAAGGLKHKAGFHRRAFSLHGVDFLRERNGRRRVAHIDLRHGRQPAGGGDGDGGAAVVHGGQQAVFDLHDLRIGAFPRKRAVRRGGGLDFARQLTGTPLARERHGRAAHGELRRNVGHGDLHRRAHAVGGVRAHGALSLGKRGQNAALADVGDAHIAAFPRQLAVAGVAGEDVRVQRHALARRQQDFFRIQHHGLHVRGHVHGGRRGFAVYRHDGDDRRAVAHRLHLALAVHGGDGFVIRRPAHALIVRVGIDGMGQGELVAALQLDFGFGKRDRRDGTAGDRHAHGRAVAGFNGRHDARAARGARGDLALRVHRGHVFVVARPRNDVLDQVHRRNGDRHRFRVARVHGQRARRRKRKRIQAVRGCGGSQSQKCHCQNQPDRD